MPNTNFQTIHQMGQAINAVVKQATGRDAVQNIDMDHVTVAQNHYYEEVTLSAGRVSFTDRVGNTPLEKCVVQIKPVQDLHGYSRPWAGGAGKNLYPVLIGDDNVTPNGNGAYTRVSGELVISTTTSGVSNTGVYLNSTTFSSPSSFCGVTSALGSAYVISFDAMSADGAQLRYGFSDDITHYVTLSSSWQRISLPMATAYDRPFCFYMANSVANTSMRIRNVQIELGTSATAYEPYSNICPITGWTGANIHVSPTTDAQDGTTYSITFPDEAGTVYGGTLEVIKGVLTVTDGHIASYNGEALPGTWISDRDVYAEGTSPTTGAEVVYELDNPITYQITPQEILTLEGQNNIWADTGDIEVTYKVLGGLY